MESCAMCKFCTHNELVAHHGYPAGLSVIFPKQKHATCFTNPVGYAKTPNLLLHLSRLAFLILPPSPEIDPGSDNKKKKILFQITEIPQSDALFIVEKHQPSLGRNHGKLCRYGTDAALIQ